MAPLSQVGHYREGVTRSYQTSTHPASQMCRSSVAATFSPDIHRPTSVTTLIYHPSSLPSLEHHAYPFSTSYAAPRVLSDSGCPELIARQRKLNIRQRELNGRQYKLDQPAYRADSYCTTSSLPISSLSTSSPSSSPSKGTAEQVLWHRKRLPTAVQLILQEQGKSSKLGRVHVLSLSDEVSLDGLPRCRIRACRGARAGVLIVALSNRGETC
jgi:hypothetical protein